MADFVPVSIKMAKEQNLSLNPTKISGVCGRLMCCLKYEQDTYEYLNSRMPSVGEKVKTPEGIIGEVKSVSVLRQLVRVVIDNGEEKELREYTVDDLRLKPRQKKDVKLTEEELRSSRISRIAATRRWRISHRRNRRETVDTVTTKMNIASAVISVTTEKDVRTGRT